MLSVCSTRPLHGEAKYSSRWRALFQANVATRPSAEMPSWSSAPASRRVRPAHSAYVVRSLPVAVSVVIVFSPNSRSARWNRSGSVSGYGDISPCIGSPPRSQAQPRQLDRRAAVHHHSQAGRAGPGGCVLVDHAELHPYGVRPDLYRLVDVRARAVGPAEDVHRLDGTGD